MDFDRLWERLIAYLNTWAQARETDGGIEVTFESHDGARRMVEIVMTPGDWQEYTSTTYGTGDPGSTDIKAMILLVPSDLRFLVYEMYELHPSPTPSLPASPSPTWNGPVRSKYGLIARRDAESGGRAARTIQPRGSGIG